jgi:hypothetical protein
MRPARPFKLVIAILFAAAGPALAADLNAEIVNAETHAGLAAQSADLAMVHTHLHHTLNCLVGPNGTGFDAAELNPCKNNGSGAIPDATKLTTKARLKVAADKARAGIAEANLAAAQKDATDTAAMLKAIK